MRLLNITFLLLPLLCYSQQPIVSGRVEVNVPVEEGSSETYTLFLPKNFVKDSLYTTVYIFDPDGRGEEALRKFVPAARLTNSILVASNIKLKDSLPAALNEGELFINKILRKWPIDGDRLILAGSGIGGLLATTSAQLSETALGVIAVEQAFINIQYTRKNSKTRYKILISDDSPNYYRMQQLNFELRLERQHLGLTQYDPTDDNWPEAGYLTGALTELLLPTENNQEVVANYYNADIEWGETIYNRSRFLTAFDFVSNLKKKYDNKILDEDPQKELLKKIRNNTGYRAMRNTRVALREREALLLDDFIFYLAEDIRNAYFDNLGWWNSQMSELDAKIDSSSINTLEKKAAHRLKGYVKNSVESRWNALRVDQKTSFEQKLFVNILRTLIDPKNYKAYLETISYSAREGDTNAALFYLEELLQNGYTDYDTLYAIPGTSAIRISEEYNTIVKEYLGKSKYYD